MFGSHAPHVTAKQGKSEPGAQTKLKAKFIAATYRYQDPSEQKTGGGS